MNIIDAHRTTRLLSRPTMPTPRFLIISIISSSNNSSNSSTTLILHTINNLYSSSSNNHILLFSGLSRQARPQARHQPCRLNTTVITTAQRATLICQDTKAPPLLWFEPSSPTPGVYLTSKQGRHQ
jgi:hypothetical protein